MIPEVDIWRIANPMLKRYDGQAEAESALWADEQAEAGDYRGEEVWRQVTNAVGRLASTTPPGPAH